MKYFKLTLFIFILSIFTACDIDGEDNRNCYSEGYTAITAVTGPAEVDVNEPIVFNVTFNIENDCGSFIRFDTSQLFPKEVAARVAYAGCECDDVETTLVKEYKFTPTQTGELEFKFLSGANQFITKKVTVN